MNHSRSELTNNYSTSDWEESTRSWNLITYLTLPSTDIPVDLPSVTYTVGSEGSS